jgi:hypothetical protein
MTTHMLGPCIYQCATCYTHRNNNASMHATKILYHNNTQALLRTHTHKSLVADTCMQTMEDGCVPCREDIGFCSQHCSKRDGQGGGSSLSLLEQRRKLFIRQRYSRLGAVTVLPPFAMMVSAQISEITSMFFIFFPVALATEGKVPDFLNRPCPLRHCAYLYR